MSAQESKVAGSVGGVVHSNRMQKSAATRAVTAAKLEKLQDNARYAYKQANALRASAEALALHIINGGKITPEVLEVCKMAEAQIGKSLFA